MGLTFADIDKAAQHFEKEGLSAKEIEEKLKKIWNENNMSEKVQKAYISLLLYGKGEIEIEDINGNSI